MKDRFVEIERDIMEGKHTAASVFTQMRTAAIYMAQPSAVPDGCTIAPRELLECCADIIRQAITNRSGAADWNALVLSRVKKAISAAPAPAGWIPVSEQLPESERTVLAFYLNSHGKGRRVRAEYIAAKTKSADDGWDSDEPADYDEQADEYFWPAGWYEVMDNWDDLTHMVIHEGGVTHWMPLPAAPGAAPSAPKADDPVKVQLLEALEELMYARTDKAEALATAAIAAARKGEGE